MPPSLGEEQKLWQRGYRFVAGVDEVGRGPLAGPVVAAAVVLPRECKTAWLLLVRDSKLLTPKWREFLSGCIREAAVGIGTGIVSHQDIDAHGIVVATRLAMSRAVAQLPQRPDFLLIDALSLPESDIPQRSIIHGDALCTSIAAASIVAKVVRDRLMTELDRLYPGYGFAHNKGYATAEHLLRLRHLGPCPLHRRSFRPVSELLERSSHQP